jgi:hypothetical protein
MLPVLEKTDLKEKKDQMETGALQGAIPGRKRHCV